MADYDISEAFGRIEDELISSMIRNFDRHRAEETDYGYNWSQWQAEQLRSLEKYRRDNQKKFGPIFRDLNVQIEQAIREMDRKGGADAEKEILRQIQAGFTPPGDGTKGVFFKTNQRKLNALVKATTDDMSKAETAILRMANDQYRKAIFNAQVYANSGAGTYEKAVDMATKDMAAAGLNCVEYKNGARHRLEDYADMAIRTANKRAYLYGEGERRQAWGVSTVIVNKRTDACPQCMPFCGKVFIDDVWSGGTAKDGDYPLISEAMAKGLYHPRCRCAHTTYFPGISTANDKWTAEELKAVKRNEEREAQLQYAERQAEKWQRIADTRLDLENERVAHARADEWGERTRQLSDEIGENDRIIRESPNTVQLNALDAPGFVEKFDKITDNKSVNDSIYFYATEALKHRNGTNKEDLILLNADTGTLVHYLSTSESDYQTDYDNATYNAIQNAREQGVRLLAIHNHPNGLPPSLDDGVSALSHGYDFGVVIGHNLETYVYGKADRIIPLEELEELHKNLVKIIAYDIDFEDSVWYDYLKEFGMEVKKL